jgi:hypothetical protein
VQAGSCLCVLGTEPLLQLLVRQPQPQQPTHMLHHDKANTYEKHWSSCCHHVLGRLGAKELTERVRFICLRRARPCGCVCVMLVLRALLRLALSAGVPGLACSLLLMPCC